MTCDAESIYVAALSLPASGRVELIRKLVASLDQSATGDSEFDLREFRHGPCPRAVPPGLQADRLFDVLGARVRT